MFRLIIYIKIKGDVNKKKIMLIIYIHNVIEIYGIICKKHLNRTYHTKSS